MGTQSEAELVSLFFPFIRPSFLSLPPHESARGRNEQLAAAPPFFVPGEKRTVKSILRKFNNRSGESRACLHPLTWGPLAQYEHSYHQT